MWLMGTFNSSQVITSSSNNLMALDKKNDNSNRSRKKRKINENENPKLLQKNDAAKEEQDIKTEGFDN